jgi:hypothetical protein
MSENRAKVDPIHALQRSFDEQTNSFHMHMTNLELEMELNAEDGDSVISKRETVEIQAEANEIILVERYSKVCMLGQESVDIKAVMGDNTELELMTLLKGVPKELCVRRIKVLSPCFIILQT